MERSLADRFIDVIEYTAAGFLAAVAAVTFVSVFLRYFFAWSIPDSYDLSCLMLGILIFWGMAGASYRGEHITVDLIWSICGPRLKRAIDLFADGVTLAGMGLFTWMAGTKVLSTKADNVLTYDVQMPVWIFYAVAWAGLASALLLLAVRVLRLFSGSVAFEPQHAPTVE